MLIRESLEITELCTALIDPGTASSAIGSELSNELHGILVIFQVIGSIVDWVHFLDQPFDDLVLLFQRFELKTFAEIDPIAVLDLKNDHIGPVEKELFS